MWGVPVVWKSQEVFAACVQHQNSRRLQQHCHGKSCGLEQCCFLSPPHFSPHKLAPVQHFWSIFVLWDLLVFYLGFHIIYLHCLLNGWAQRACILCWRDEKDPGQRPARTQANKKKTTFCSQMLRAWQWGSFRPTNLVTLYNI